jgi:hypothetical protein
MNKVHLRIPRLALSAVAAAIFFFSGLYGQRAAEITPVEPELVKSADLELISNLAVAAGDEIVSAENLGNPDAAPVPQVRAKDSDGMEYYIFGTACNVDTGCYGIQFQVIFSPSDTPYTFEIANQMTTSFAAVSVFLTDSGNISVSRYLILDHGQAFENLELNLLVFKSISKKIQGQLNDLSDESETEVPEI